MKVRIKDYPRNLELMVNSHILDYLEAGSKEILINRARALKSAIKRGGNWRFSMPKEKPLTFKTNYCNLQVDIACELDGIGENINKQNITLRIWCRDKDISYREGIDSPDLQLKLENNCWKRVILRFHFDKREPNGEQLEPPYHLQVGGRYRTEDEYCWLHEEIDVPRFSYHPMDIILLCEFILINFFPKKSKKLREKPEWRSLVRKCQTLFLKPYYDAYLRYLNDDTETLLSKLVSPYREA